MSQMVMFILLGVGIDDMFIIVGCWDHAELHAEESSEDVTSKASDLSAKRLAVTLREAGPSITLTSVTDCIAFAIGSTIDLPGISDFCKTAGIAIIATFVLQVTLFSALLVMDEHRAAKLRLDCCPCILSAEGKNANGKQAKISTVRGSSTLREWLHTKYAPWLMRPTSKVGILVAFLCLWCISAWGVSTLTKGLEVILHIPDCPPAHLPTNQPKPTNQPTIGNGLHTKRQFCPQVGPPHTTMHHASG
jgi:predicted RND superfamily exporter protein